MHTKIILGITLSVFFTGNVLAEETMVQSLSQGACWYEQGEFLRVASFNEKEAIVLSRDEIELQIEALLSLKRKHKPASGDLVLHCGGYGSSLVVKTVVDNLPVCLWLKSEKGQLSIRSFGGLEITKSDLCDGYRWGELIVGIKSVEQKEMLQSESFRSIVKSVTIVSSSTVKVTLSPEYKGREIEAMNELKKQIDLKYIELNFYQHPVGEAAVIK
jgi:hypothetical protein